MRENEVIIFEVMVLHVDVLYKAIEQHNNFENTNFEIVEVIDNEVVHCKIKASKYKIEDLFNLGHRLYVLEHMLCSEGKI